jgi:hypothetical protein
VGCASGYVLSAPESGSMLRYSKVRLLTLKASNPAIFQCVSDCSLRFRLAAIVICPPSRARKFLPKELVCVKGKTIYFT